MKSEVEIRKMLENQEKWLKICDGNCVETRWVVYTLKWVLGNEEDYYHENKSK